MYSLLVLDFSIQFKKHLHSLYDDKLFFPFNSICEIFKTSLVLDNILVEQILDDVERKFSQQIIHPHSALSNHTYEYPEFYMLCFVIPPNKHSILVLTVIPKKEDKQTCNHMPNSKTWELLLKCWGWDTNIPKSCDDIKDFVEKLSLQYKLDSIYSQYIQMEKTANSMIETDNGVIQWIQDSSIHIHDSFSLSLHAICTPSVFLCYFFKAMKESRIYPVMTDEEKELNEALITPISSHPHQHQIGHDLYIGNHFYFLYESSLLIYQ